jgi:mono/diheme cytochrome c family protein
MKFNKKSLLAFGAAILTVSITACANDEITTGNTIQAEAVSVSENPYVFNKSAEIQVAAADAVIPEGYTTNKDGLYVHPDKPDQYFKVIGGEWREVYDDGFPKPQQKKKLGKAPPIPADAMTPLERVKSAPVGSLHNPYARDLKQMAVWGKKNYFANSCNGCHGGTGGGGMCPPLSNSTWVYGYDDDTLFRLITLGSVELQKQLKTSRKGRENVVGPMPAFGEIIKTDDEIWRIISFLRTIYKGDPKFDARNVH